MKTKLNYIKSKKLSEHFVDVGVSSSLRNKNNNDMIKSCPQKIDFLKVEKIFSNLRKSLYLTSDIIAKKGHIVVYSPSLKVTDSTKQFKQNNWVHGLISNFKTVRKVGTKFPNFIVIMTNDTKEQEGIENEALRTQIPSLFVNNSNNLPAGLFSIPGNNITEGSTNYIADLFISAITAGHLKEIASLNSKKRFPRLDSNQ